MMPPESGLRSEPGPSPLFDDARIQWADDQLGFSNKTILELGPLEAAHTHMMERLGASSITSIESNTRAFLKCLCVKEIFDLRKSRFLLGNFMPFLATCGDYDVIVASGVLYHMTEPLRLLQLISEHSDHVFIWTHYFDRDIIEARFDRHLFSTPEKIEGSDVVGARRVYDQVALDWDGFSGGVAPYAIWLEKSSIVNFFEQSGFNVTVGFELPEAANGPAFALCARKDGAP